MLIRNSFPKINLFLNVTGRKNGFHTLNTLFLKLKYPFDTLYIKRGKLTVKAGGINEKENIVYKILRDNNLNYSVKIIKRIPAGRGLGGGSSNAATIIKALHIKTEPERYGMDINFFLKDTKIAYATGFGDKIKPLNYKRKISVILIVPPIKKSTSEIYEIYDRNIKKFVRKEVTSYIMKMVYDNLPFKRWFGILFNDLEEAFFTKYPDMRKLKKNIYELTGIAPVMSGAGSCFFIPYSLAAMNALKKLKNCKIIHTWA